MCIQTEPERVPKFNKDHIQQDCQQSPATSAGWDQWEAADWKYLSDTPAQYLADLLNMIEEGRPWPEPQHWGKAHLIGKTEEASLDPYDYRILLVLQRLYRRWASMRLQHLSRWIEKWQLEEMYAGVKGGGAEAAWLSTALDTELANLQQAEHLMAMMDIWKCFDQIIPVLARLLLGLAGMPTSTPWAYTRPIAEVKTVNCLSMVIGKTYRRT